MRLFDDASSFVHMLMGAALPFLKKDAAIAVWIGFAAYQLTEAEPLENKLGDFAEFGIGWAGSRAIMEAQ